MPDAIRILLEPALRQAATAKSSVFSVELEQNLLELLPSELRDACPRLTYYWGDNAQGTARWSIRSLAWQLRSGTIEALIAYRCGSTHPDYADYYDERLGLLVFESSGARLRLIPLADDCDNCSDLYHLDYSDSFPLPEGELVAVTVTDSSDNPCCDGPSAWRRESLLYLVLPAGDIALQFDRAQENYDHDDEAGDTEEICNSEITYRRAPEGELIEIAAATTCRVNGDPQPGATLQYRWNAAKMRFELLPETQP
ncbi:MAG: hypothetical protein ACRD4D_04400 [Candidatus Acidiferrales bacterium]